MTILFVFFVLPLVTILLAIVLQKILKNPILVGITFFAIYLIVAFLAFTANLSEAIIGAIILAIIAFITAVIVQLICILRQRFCGDRIRHNSCNQCCCNDLLTINSNCNSSNDNNSVDSDNTGNSVCNNTREGFVLSTDVMQSGNDRRRCCNRGYYRRF